MDERNKLNQDAANLTQRAKDLTDASFQCNSGVAQEVVDNMKKNAPVTFKEIWVERYHEIKGMLLRGEI